MPETQEKIKKEESEAQQHPEEELGQEGAPTEEEKQATRRRKIEEKYASLEPHVSYENREAVIDAYMENPMEQGEPAPPRIEPDLEELYQWPPSLMGRHPSTNEKSGYGATRRTKRKRRRKRPQKRERE
jgi:hypothetical protein